MAETPVGPAVAAAMAASKMEERLSRQNGLKRYEQNQVPPPGDPQANEAWALIQAARQLAAIIQFGDLAQAEDRKRFREALRLNLRIWTIIQAEQLTGDNPLPEPIRRNILTLCNFIDRHTLATIAEPSVQRAIVLIDINRNIAAGLAGSPDDSTVPESSQSTQRDASDEALAIQPALKVEIDS